MHKHRGLVARIANQLFKDISKLATNEREIDLYFSMFELYNDEIRDLGLAYTKEGNRFYNGQDLALHEDSTGFVYID
jgi:hypothetical protein